ncbi:hypothetical protein [Bacillus cereus]|nr:hypothetical protein [Bacillus cereus]MCU5666586.1 hypothetical protein [Bacillus cereus]
MELLWDVKYIDINDQKVEISMLGADRNNVILQLSMFHKVKEVITIEEVR